MPLKLNPKKVKVSRDVNDKRAAAAIEYLSEYRFSFTEQFMEDLYTSLLSGRTLTPRMTEVIEKKMDRISLDEAKDPIIWLDTYLYPIISLHISEFMNGGGPREEQCRDLIAYFHKWGTLTPKQLKLVSFIEDQEADDIEDDDEARLTGKAIILVLQKVRKSKIKIFIEESHDEEFKEVATAYLSGLDGEESKPMTFKKKTKPKEKPLTLRAIRSKLLVK